MHLNYVVFYPFCFADERNVNDDINYVVFFNPFCLADERNGNDDIT